MKIRIILVSFAAVLTGAVVAVAAHALSGQNSSTRVALASARVSTSGTPVVPTGQAAQMLNTIDPELFGTVSAVGLLATRADQSFYRVVTTKGNGCYAAGPAGDATGQVTALGILLCPEQPAFPSTEKPILDFSVTTRSTTGNDAHLSSVEGFAADGVASIDLLGPNNSTLSTIPARDNVYYAGPAMSSLVVGIVARDASGHEVGPK